MKTDSTMPEYRWRCITENAPFAPRDGAGALTFNNRMFLLGGWNPRDKEHFPDICNSEVWVSDDGLDWELICQKAPWEGRHTAGYAVFQGRMWIVGGDGNQGHYQNDVWSSEDGVHWDCITDDVPWGPRVLHYTTVFDDKIWIMGGQTLPQFAPETEKFFGDVWCSPDGRNWERVLEAAPWVLRGLIGGSAVHKNCMWILGGGTYDTPLRPTRDFCNDVWSSADGQNWHQVSAKTPWAPRQYHDVAAFDDHLWVLEGYNGMLDGNRKDVWHSADGVEWHEVPDTPWLPRHASSIFVHQDALWVVAGNNMTSDVWKLERVDSLAV